MGSIAVKVISLVALLIAGQSLQAVETEISTSDDLIASANALNPGDVLILQGGTYTLSTLFSLAIDGSAGQPIVIRAKAGQTPVIYRPNANHNLIDIEASHLIIDGIIFTGGSRGIRLRSASDLTLRNCEIYNTEEAAITANDSGETYLRLNIEGNNIHDTGGGGEGLYLGCNSNACRVAQSVVRGNWIHHTNALDVTQGDGIDLKEGSYDNLIVDNVIHDTGYPCIIAGGTVGNGSRNRIERNAIWNCGDYGIQVTADTLVRNNIIVAAAAGGIAVQPLQNATPANLEIVHNTVLQPTGDALRLTNVSGAIAVYNNALYSQLGHAMRATGVLAGVVYAGNAGQGLLLGVTEGFTGNGNPVNDFLGLGYGTTPPGNAFPATGGLLLGIANLAHLAPSDFNSNSRVGDATVGAYRHEATGNPGWVLEEGFKPLALLLFADGFENPDF